jgi:hypothetical protein
VLLHSVVLPTALTSPGARHCDLHPAEGPKQRPRAAAVPVAGDTTGAIGILRIRLWTTAVARAGKRRLELGLDHRLDELAHPIAQTGFDRIKPIVEKMDRRLRLLMQNRRLRGIVDHGVVSTGAPTPDRLGFSTRRLRHLQFQPNPGRRRQTSEKWVIL